MKTSILSAIFMMFICSSCATVGHKINPDDIDQLQPSVSTIADATAIFGKYTSRTVRSDGVSIYVWSYIESNGFTGKGTGETVALSFDADGKLMQKTQTSTNSQLH